MCGSDWNRPKDYRRAVVIDKGPKKYDEREHSSEWMQKSVQKRLDRADVVIALGKAWKRRNRR